jgi:uncharacterized protein VirK/YbjX
LHFVEGIWSLLLKKEEEKTEYMLTLLFFCEGKKTE